MTSTPRHRRLKDRVDRTLGGLVAALMGLAVLNVLWQVFTRYVLESPSAYTDELSRYLLIWMGLLGASYAAGQRMHLAIDLLPNLLAGASRHALGLAIDLLVVLFALLVMVVGGLRLVALTLMLEQTSAALGILLGYVYLALPISGALIVFYGTLFALEHLRALRGDSPQLPGAELESAAAFGTAGVAAGAPTERTAYEPTTPAARS